MIHIAGFVPHLSPASSGPIPGIVVPRTVNEIRGNAMSAKELKKPLLHPPQR